MDDNPLWSHLQRGCSPEKCAHICSQAYPITGLSLSYHRPVPQAYPIIGLSHRPILSQAYPYPITGLSHRPILPQAYPAGLCGHRPILSPAYPITGQSHRPILSQAYPYPNTGLSYHRPILHVSFRLIRRPTFRPHALSQHSKLETFQVLSDILLTMATRAPPQPIVQEERQTERQA